VRDALLFLLIFSTIPFILKRPVVGTLTYAVVGLMNPHRLAHGAAYDFPFAMVLCVITLLSLLISREQKKIPMTGAVVALLLFIAWTSFTALFAQEPALAWLEWQRVMKTMLMVVLTILTVRTVADLKALVLVVALSLGFWGFKGGLFTILSGGQSRVLGPAGSYISDNNTLALAMITIVPLMFFLVTLAHSKWQKRAAMALAFLTIAAALGSYSRGAMLGGAGMLFFLWLKSKAKVKTGLAILLLAPVVFAVMPEQWTGRMESIDNYQEDASAMGRINAWRFALNVAANLPTGGGFGVFTPRMFQFYAPEPQRFYVAHSIYFQVLGDHGYFGLLLYLLLFLFAWRTGSRTIRYCTGKPDLAWAAKLAQMCQVSMIGFMMAGAFLSMPYYDLIYYIIAILVTLEKVLILAPQPDNTAPMKLPFLHRFLARKPA
jgi:probable O-glycosylation ligase (exosortase A-associated)